MTRAPTPKDIDEYIGGYPPDVQGKLQKIRETIRKAAPNADPAHDRVPGPREPVPEEGQSEAMNREMERPVSA